MAVWGAGLVSAGIILFIVYNNAKKQYDKEWDDGKFLVDTPWGLMWIPIISLTLIGLMMATSAVTRMANPEFYAIRYLLEQISGGI